MKFLVSSPIKQEQSQTENATLQKTDTQIFFFFKDPYWTELPDADTWVKTAKQTSKVEKSLRWFVLPSVYLIVQVQVVKLPIGSELLCVVVQGEVDVSSVALYDNRMPVVIVQ